MLLAGVRVVFLALFAGAADSVALQATNIAELSLTIDDVVYVVDTGKVKSMSYNPVSARLPSGSCRCRLCVDCWLQELDMSFFSTQWIARSNVVQRRGRAGRVRPGFCYHMYSRDKFAAVRQPQQPHRLLIVVFNSYLTFVTLLRCASLPSRRFCACLCKRHCCR